MGTTRLSRNKQQRPIEKYWILNKTTWRRNIIRTTKRQNRHKRTKRHKTKLKTKNNKTKKEINIKEISIKYKIEEAELRKIAQKTIYVLILKEKNVYPRGKPTEEKIKEIYTKLRKKTNNKITKKEI